MIARVVAVESGSKFTDGKRRVTLRFEGASYAYRELQVAEELLAAEVKLDAEFVVNFEPKTLSQKGATCHRW